ncbi:outer membrane protein [Bartonella sp. AU18XJBT]|uniref:outer membrane protein n=1 Tax=Bartonella sp. AU18XJBT TaxID=3019089 RepID=UPI00235E7A02|nr:outer membrane beta-barrel protein [Bartonella sp. AU18XJBT]
MNTKRLITASIFSLISASTALAADVMIPHQPASSTSSTIVAPTFSWTGLYLGVQAGGFSSKADMALVGQEKSFPLDKEFSPKLSGFVGGFYAGSNIDLGDNFVFGVDTDLMISGKKHTKTITIGAADNTTVENAVVRSRRSANPQTPPATQAQQIASGGSAVAGTPTPAKPASATPVSAGATAVGTPVAGSVSGKSVTTQSSPAQHRSVNTVQSSQAGAAQSNQAATGKSNNVNETAGKTLTAEGTSGVSTPASKTPSASPVAQSSPSKTVQAVSSSLGRSDTGGATVGQVGRSQPAAPKPTSHTTGAGTSVQSASRSATVSVVPAPVKPTVTVPASTPVAKASTSVQSSSQPSAVEKTVPSAPLVLARSGSSSESATASNGTSGAQHGGHHGVHGSGSTNPHGASHAGGHGSGAHAHGANPHASRSHGAQSTQAVDKNDSSVYGIEQMKKMASELGLEQEDEVETLSHTFKQNWGGATRVRIGFAADRFMPYLAGGIAYGQFQDTVSISVKDDDGRVVSSKNLADETKTMIGYTLGGGVDFSLLDNVIVRAEYRYSDFGKKKFAKEKLEVNYKTNDFRVGVAYKF